MKMTRRIALLTVLATLGLVGCGDDDDSTVASDKTTTTAATDDGDIETYCEKSVEIEALGEPDIDFESASEDEIAEASKSFASDEVLPLALAIQEAVPEADRENVDVLVGAVRELVESGDFDTVFDRPEVKKASAADHVFGVEQCGWAKVDVTAIDYEFKGIPDELDAGVTSFEFSNEGTEQHELIIIRKNDDTTETFEELLQLPEEEARTKTTFVDAAFGSPGEEGVYAVADLEAGEYIALCFIPVGSVDPDDHDVDGPPHFTQGMKHEFTVS